MNTNALCWLFLLFLCRGVLPAQEVLEVKEEYLLIRTHDGNEYTGRLLRSDSAVVVIETRVFAELVLPRGEIRRMRSVSPEHARPDFLLEGTPIAGSYFANTSAYGVPAGKGYYSSAVLLYHQVAFGLSEHVSVRGNIFLDFYDYPTWVAPKISVPVLKDAIQVALEGSIGRGFNVYYNDVNRSDLSLLQALITLGKRSMNLTAGGGVSWGGAQWAQRPFFSVASSVSAGKRWVLMSENYFFRVYGEDERLDIIGARYHGRKFSFSLGVVSARQGDILISTIIPWAGAMLNFY